MRTTLILTPTAALTITAALALAALTGCGGPSIQGDTSLGGSTDACGDPDGDGGETGDVPNILGKWTTTFGTYEYDRQMCDLPGLEQDDMHWINGYMEIGGRIPDNLIATFDGDEDEQFWGIENEHGGVVFTGTHVIDGHTLYVSVGGLLYQSPQVDREYIRGFGYIGVDKDSEDTVIDCWLQGDFVASKSGN